MSIFDVVDWVTSNGYDDIEDYCNQTGQNICDVCPDPDEEDDDWDW